MRWLGLTGLAFVGLFVLAIVLYGNGAGSNPSQIVDYYASPASRMRQIAGHLLIEDAAFVVVVSAMAIAIPFVAVISLAASASGELPRWFAVLGFIAVLGLAAAYWYLPLFAFLVWIASGSLLVWRRSPYPSATPTL
jgi:hypothetical protein